LGTPSLTEQRVSLRDGRTLGFAEFGDPNGDPVLEFHGCPGSRLEAWNYDEVGKKLGARVIGIDRPGFGISTYVKGYRIVDWPADVSEFADALGLERFAVAGISSGSPYALASARFIPERLKGCAIVSGRSPLTVEGEKLDPSHYLMAEELLMARLAKTVPRAIFRYMLWQISRIRRVQSDT
jgi:pimeloyl-ACP methyl ester carboxylesterase